MTRYGDADVPGILATHGLTPRVDGYSLMDVERFATARGWRCSIEPVSSRPAGGKPKRRFRAMVIASGDPRVTERPSHQLGLRQARATGPSEVASLALAVVRMLAAIMEHAS